MAPKREPIGLSTFLPDATVQRLRSVLDTADLGLVCAADLAGTLEGIARHRPAFVFTGLEFAPLHAPSLIAALKSCPFHRSVPVVVITPQDPRLLDLSFYRPDVVVGEGAEFEATILDYLRLFKVTKPNETTPSPGQAWIHCSGRILLVESSTMAQRIVGKLLHVAGADVTVVENGWETMLMTAVREFDLILIDLELPDADPTELVRFLRSVGPETRIVGLACEDADPAMAGVDTILHKPVLRSHLLSLCSRFLGQPGRLVTMPEVRKVG